MIRPLDNPWLGALCHLLAILLLGGVCWYAFEPALDGKIITLDDDIYVRDNPRVQEGLNKRGVDWAFGYIPHAYLGHKPTWRCWLVDIDFLMPNAGNYHPLTWLSLMADSTCFGRETRAYHSTNVALHILNTALFYLLLVRILSCRWTALALAAIWAIHPLRVESVAWISERKDVLSGAFGLLAVHLHLCLKRQSSILAEALATLGATLLMALSLLAKPMFVSLPLLLILLDFWPRRSIGIESSKWNDLKTTAIQLLRSAAWKLPMAALAVWFSFVALRAQELGGAVTTIDNITLLQRVCNSIVAYGTYLYMMANLLWPYAVIYPHPGDWPLWILLLNLCAMLIITASVILWLPSRPSLAAGWAWYLIGLVPVIGLVQIGVQSMADRYTYIPMIGLLIGLGGALVNLARRIQLALVALLLATCIPAYFITRKHAGYWIDSFTLLEHTIAVTNDNASAMNSLGAARMEAGHLDAAIGWYNKALAIRPLYAEGWNNLANAEAAKNDFAAAYPHYENAMRLKENYFEAFNNYGEALTRDGKFDHAIALLNKCLEIKPDFAPAYYNLGIAYAKLNRLEEGVAAFRRSLDIDPRSGKTHNNLGVLMGQLGRKDEMLKEYRIAVELEPGNPEALNNLAVTLVKNGDAAEPIELLKRALTYKPGYLEARLNLAEILMQVDQVPLSIQMLQIAAQQSPNHPRIQELANRINAMRQPPPAKP